MKKPLILVTNDDGITAQGILELVNAARQLGDVLVVAPDSPQSAKGHAITISQPIFLTKSDIFGDIEAYECSGTPVDCVKMAKAVILEGRMPDLCVSGINHGSNAAINILYSGTVSAAMEAAIEGVPSIGFSFLNYRHDADFSVCRPVVNRIMQHVLEHGMEVGSLYNVNIPDLPLAELKGIKVCRQAQARWVEEYVKQQDPRGREYYWLSGRFVNEDERPDTDASALLAGYVSVVPSTHDLTNVAAFTALKQQETELQIAGTAAADDPASDKKQQLEQFQGLG
ncbi:MAG: 5'/3'-nucleotidase SurE [Bacteroidota bacterium]